MKFDLKKPSIIILAVLVAAALRFIPAAANFSAFGAVAILAGGVLSSRWSALGIVFGGLFISDLVINNTLYAHVFDGFVFFDPDSWGRYLSYGLIILMSSQLFNKITPGRVLGGSLLSSIIFFLVSNFAVWTTGIMYPMSAEGLYTCYVMAIPFMGWQVVSTLVFSVIFFGVHHWAVEKQLVSSKVV